MPFQIKDSAGAAKPFSEKESCERRIKEPVFLDKCLDIELFRLLLVRLKLVARRTLRIGHNIDLKLCPLIYLRLLEPYLDLPVETFTLFDIPQLGRLVLKREAKRPQ